MKKNLFYLLALLFFSCTPNPKLTEADNCNYGVFTKSLNNPQVEQNGERLVIKTTAKTDYFNDPNGKLTNGNAPIIMRELDMTKPFTFTVKVKPNLIETYDAGVLYLFCNEYLWQKLCIEKDERKLNRVVSVRTENTSDDNNHDVITQESLYFKISSNSQAIGFYYSLDNVNWQLVKVHENKYPNKIYLGLSSQSPIGKGMTTEFSEFKFEQKSIKNFRLGL